MLLNHTSILMVSLALAVPYMEHCECEFEEPVPVEECKEVYEDDCRTCLQDECCEGLAACEYDADCSCMLDCMAEGDAYLAACAADSCYIFNYEDMNKALEPLTSVCETEEKRCGSGETRYCAYPTAPKPN